MNLINTYELHKMDQDRKQRQRFGNVTLFDGMASRYTIVTSKSVHELREMSINNSNCDIRRQMRGVETKYELKEQVNMEIPKVLSNKRDIKIQNNNRHLLICESECTIEMTGIKYRMLKHVRGYDQLSIGRCIAVGAQGSNDLFNSALTSAHSFGIVYSYQTKYYKKYLQKIHNMELYIRPYPTKLSFNSENFDANPMILVANSKIESKRRTEFRDGYIEHMALSVLSKDNGDILSETIIRNLAMPGMESIMIILVKFMLLFYNSKY